MHLLTEFEVKFLPSSSFPNSCSIQIQSTTANDCPVSAHHVNPTTALILLSLTEWQLHAVFTAFLSPYYNTRVP
ncbi:predicted protein [Lichtheimia corymbifera JMRC:FSU:9682]|uniref:Uncharacterized protein n=1 Tax=Lichtheimia corymbifera JMRC:FSU:9682 TaxID=1263082 RepID=A0A068RGV1_9FUNG|nr:predicted protein [Lichtheimia corymbifera JMRC:FSU:9682]